MTDLATKALVDDDLRLWIAENLLLGVAPQSIHAILASRGVVEYEIVSEIKMAITSPYLRGAIQASDRLKSRLKKYIWVFDIYRSLARQASVNVCIDRRHQLSKEDFYSYYYLQNRPVIITGVIDSWPALKKWSFAYFKNKFGEREVQVQVGRSKDPNYEVNSLKHGQMMSMRSY